MACFKALYRRSPGSTEKDHVKSGVSFRRSAIEIFVLGHRYSLSKRWDTQRIVTFQKNGCVSVGLDSNLTPL